MLTNNLDKALCYLNLIVAYVDIKYCMYIMLYNIYLYMLSVPLLLCGILTWYDAICALQQQITL